MQIPCTRCGVEWAGDCKLVFRRPKDSRPDVEIQGMLCKKCAYFGEQVIRKFFKMKGGR